MTMDIGLPRGIDEPWLADRHRIYFWNLFLDDFSAHADGDTPEGAGIASEGGGVGKKGPRPRRAFRVDARPRRSPSARSEISKKKKPDPTRPTMAPGVAVIAY